MRETVGVSTVGPRERECGRMKHGILAGVFCEFNNFSEVFYNGIMNLFIFNDYTFLTR